MLVIISCHLCYLLFLLKYIDQNILQNIDIKNHAHYTFNDMINIKNLDPKKIKIDEKSYKNILIYYIGYVTIKDLRYINY